MLLDGSGWVACQAQGGATGLIPATYVEIEQFYEAPAEAAPIQRGKNCERSMGSLAHSVTNTVDPSPPVRALFDYDAQSDLELTIRQGDVLLLTSTDCSEGWWEGNNSQHDL